jgi:cellulose synthase/poly-beta-1,6-N-acetylglucosamine synthase-like glycosyltransferase/exo-beta-1,3-glucanase (GH17 family)
MRSVAAVVALVACLHAGLWAIFKTTGSAPNIEQSLASVSYAPFEGISDPNDPASRPTPAQIRADLKAIAPYTQTIRTYKSTGGLELVPAIAAEFGLKVTLGIWLDTNADQNGKYDDRNEREIRSALDLARRYSNVNAIVVGNETTLRGSLFEANVRAEADRTGRSVADVRAEKEAALRAEAEKSGRTFADLKAERNIDELMKIIQRVKRQSPVPVTTGETWDVWRDYPKLASAVDFIGAHILPYWDGSPASQAVDHTIDVYYRLRQIHPGKRIVIAEFGWPSAGYNRKASEPGRIEQALVLRDFVARADALGIDYNIIEAYDQPWKSFEGSVGSYWGLFDAARQPKFSWVGPVGNPDYWKIAAIAIAVGFLVSLPILSIAGATLNQALLLALASHGVGAWAATVFEYWNGHYFVLGAAFALILGLILLVPLVLIALSRIEEIAAILFGRAPARLLPPMAPVEGYAPKVSIHVPAYMEPPEMLKQTLDAVARLDYPNFECVVVINNTPDEAYWRPIEEHCRTLGERFKFVNVDKLQGYKAGALRLALTYTASDAEIIGVIDADYTVHPNWLKDLVPAFIDPKVGLVQAPQDHRDESTPLHWAMNGEYAGFFDIGMVQRNEENAIVVHGTMCLIRRAALDSAGGWSSDTICEDTDLGLTIIEQGWLAHYTNRRYGYGLLPDTFEAYKKQRHRWAYGGLQIIRKHWRHFLPGMSRLTPDQKREFTIGWLNWLGAESIGVVVAILNLIWVPVVAFVGVAIPDKVLTLPIMAAFAVSIAHFVALYRRRVAISTGHRTAAMIAAMSMQWTVARAVAFGLIKDHLPFVRTAKGGQSRKRVAFPAFYEAVMGSLLVLGAAIVFATNYEQVREINLFGYVLLVQSLPFLAAAALAAFEETRFNSFAFWKSLETRLVEGLLRRPALTHAARPADNRVETVR